MFYHSTYIKVLSRKVNKFNLTIVALFLLSFCFQQRSFSQQAYERKSVTSLGAVLFKTTPAPEIVDLINNRLKYHLELPRFDFNALSKEATKEFVEKANKTDLSQSSIQRQLEATIVPQIVSAVNAVAEERPKGNLKEQDLARAAVDKLKGSGLTAEDVMNVMNSAYLYLPVVTGYDSDDSSASISGYVLWYRIVQKDGKASVTAVNSQASERGIGSGDPKESYRLKSRSVHGTEYARIIAVNTWAKNLAVDMKKIPAFSLGGEVKNIDGRTLEVNLGKKEGLGLDDGYIIIEEQEDSKGNVSTKEVGFIRASKIGNNTQNATENSAFYTHIGSGLERGMSVREHPVLGLDVSFGLTFPTVNIPKEATIPFGFGLDNNGQWLFQWSDNAKGGAGAELGIALNLAKITGIRQFFLTLNGGFNTLTTTEGTNDNAFIPFPKATLTSSLYDVSAGFKKKFWFGRVNLSASIEAAARMLNIKDGDVQQDSLVEEVQFTTIGVKAGLGLEFLLSPDWMLNAGVSYYALPAPDKYEVKTKGESSFTEYDMGSPNIFDDNSFSGATFSLNVTYSIPSLFFDPFANITASGIDY